MEAAIPVLGCQPTAELHGSTHRGAQVGQACCAHVQHADTDPFGKPGSSVLVMPVPSLVCFAYQGNW